MGKKAQRRPNARKKAAHARHNRLTKKKGASDTLKTQKRRSSKSVKTVIEPSAKTKLRLQIEYVPIDKVIPFSGNPRRNDDSVDAVVRSIESFGYTNPILVRRADNIIIAGHTRLKALQKLGRKEVPVIYLDLNEVDARVYGVFDNKSVELADWDGLKLADLFVEFDQIDVDLSLTGFSPDEINDIILGPIDLEANPEDDVIPEVPKKAKTKVGDLYILGQHRLLCGDSTKKKDVERLMGGKKAALLVTDPPYLVDYIGNKRPRGKGKNWGRSYRDVFTDKPEDKYKFYFDFFQNVLPYIKKNAAIYIWRSDKWACELKKAMHMHKILFHQDIIWRKPCRTLTFTLYHPQHETCSLGWQKGYKPPHVGLEQQTYTTVWDCDWEGKARIIGQEHPTQKPIKLFTIPIGYHTKKNEICLEPFCGSGSQIIAAEKLKRICYAIEIQPIFVDVAIKRWEDYTGQKADLAAQVAT